MDEETFKLGIRRTLFNRNLKTAITSSGLTHTQIRAKTGITETTLSYIINFKFCPKEEHKVALAVLLNIPIETIFPEKYDEIYEKLSPIKREVDVEINMLSLDAPEVLALEAPEDVELDTSNRFEVERLLSCLPPRELELIQMRHGLEDGHTKTLEEVSEHFGVTRERIRQMEAKAHERMRQYAKGKRNYPEDYKEPII